MKIKPEIEKYFEIASNRLKHQDIVGAINLLSKILDIDPVNKRALTEKAFLEEILRFKNIDIFSNTNLFMDPWE